MNTQRIITGSKIVQIISKIDRLSQASFIVSLLQNIITCLGRIFEDSVILRKLFLDMPRSAEIWRHSLVSRWCSSVWAYFHGLLHVVVLTVDKLYEESLTRRLFRRSPVAILIFFLGIVLFGWSAGYLLPAVVFVLAIVFFGIIYKRNIAGILFILLFVPIELTVVNYVPYQTKYIVEATLLILLGAIILNSIKREKPRFELNDLDIPIMLLVGAVALSWVANRVPLFIGAAGSRALLEFALLYFIFTRIKPNEKQLKYIFTAVIFLGGILSIYGIGQRVIGIITPYQWVDISETRITTRVFATMINPNTFGGYLLALSPIAASFCLSSALSPLWRLTFGGIFLLMVPALLLTYSRGALLGLILALIIVSTFMNRRFLVIGALSAIFIPIAMPSMIQRLAFGFSSAYLAKSSTAGRVFVWLKALESIKIHPWFGVGPGRFGGSVAAMFGSPAYEEVGMNYNAQFWLDNQFIQVWAEFGTVGITAFLILCLAVIRNAYQIAKHSEDSFKKALSVGIIAAFSGLLIQSLVAGIWEIHQTAVYLWTMMAAVMAIRAGVNHGAR